MHMDHSTEDIQKKIDQLPLEVLQIVNDPAVAKKLQELGTAAGLSFGKANELAKKANLFMLGLINANEFIGRIASLGLPQDKADELADKIDADIFESVHEKLMRVYETENTGEETLIEVAEKPARQSMLESKLGTHAKVPKKHADYSPEQAKPAADPYREPIE